MADHQPARAITVVVVLYGTTPSTSPALTTLAQAVEGHAHSVAVQVHDNSPTPSEEPGRLGPLHVEYAWHPDNPGLAGPYSDALDAAERRGSDWLMLLDQDTRVTRDYVEEVLQLASTGVDPSVAAAVPQLFSAGALLSPHKPLRICPRALGTPGTYGPSTRYSFLNSGCLLRVGAVHAVGGIPEEYPLDHLDLAMAARFRQAGYSLLVLESRLEHDLSVLDMTSLSPVRLRSIFRAEEKYYGELGTRGERLWLLARRAARGVLVLTAVRSSPDRGEELRAVWRAARLALAFGIRDRHASAAS